MLQERLRIIIVPINMGGSRGIATVVDIERPLSRGRESFRLLGKKSVEGVVNKKGK